MMMYSISFTFTIFLLILQNTGTKCYPLQFPTAEETNKLVDANLLKLQNIIRDMKMDRGDLYDATEEFGQDEKIKIQLTGGSMTGFGSATRGGDYVPSGILPTLQLNGTTRTPVLDVYYNYNADGTIKDQGTFKLKYQNVKAHFSIIIDTNVSKITSAIIQITDTGKIEFEMKSRSPSDPISNTLKKEMKDRFMKKIESIFEKRVSDLLVESSEKQVQDLIGIFTPPRTANS